MYIRGGLFFPFLPSSRSSSPYLLTVMMDRRAKCIDGINPTIYHHKNSHSHMIKSHDWLVQLTPTLPPCNSQKNKQTATANTTRKEKLPPNEKNLTYLQHSQTKENNTKQIQPNMNEERGYLEGSLEDASNLKAERWRGDTS